MKGKELVDYLYYRCLPKFYIEEDSKLGEPLYRYLQSIVYGGYDYNIEAANNLVDLINPETCPEEYVRILWESFGFSYYEEIDTEYYRKFLMNYGELIKRRGTFSGVRFLSRVLTGMDVHLRYFRGELFGEYGRFLIVGLLAESEEDVESILDKFDVLEKFISDFVPYYITTSMLFSVRFNQSLYYGQKLVTTNFTTIDCGTLNDPDVLLDELDNVLLDELDDECIDSFAYCLLADEQGRVLIDDANVGYSDI